jgi:hypothetical protein
MAGASAPIVSVPGGSSTRRVARSWSRAIPAPGRTGASSAWAALDDNVLQPTVPNAPDYIQPSAKGQVTTVGFATKALNGAVPRGATVFYYGSTYGGDTKLQLDARWGGATRATYTLSTGQAFAWRSLSVSPTNQAAVDDLNLRLTALGGTHTIVTAVYIKLDTS